MFFRMPESSKTEPAERHADDLAQLQLILDNVLSPTDPGVTLKSLFRLGAKQDNPRPLKALFTCRDDAVRILAGSRRLKGQLVVIKPDRTPEDRVRMREAVTELRSRQAQGEQHLGIRNFRVVRLNRILQHPVRLRPGGQL